MMKQITLLLLISLLVANCGGDSAPVKNNSPFTAPPIATNANGIQRSTAMLTGKWGVSISYLYQQGTTNENWVRQLQSFNIPALVDQLQSVGAGYFMISMAQNTTYVLSPNSQIADASGNQRDVIMELAVALKAANIPLILYMTSNPLNGYSIDQWYPVVKEYSDKFGPLVSAWFFDGASLLSPNFWFPFLAAARSGNPNALVTFNTDMDQVKYCVFDSLPYEDFVAGENNDPGCAVPGMLMGHQFHVLTYAGSEFGHGTPRFTDNQFAAYTQRITSVGGAITWDTPYNTDGTLVDAFVTQMRAMGAQ